MKVMNPVGRNISAETEANRATCRCNSTGLYSDAVAGKGDYGTHCSCGSNSTVQTRVIAG